MLSSTLFEILSTWQSPYWLPNLFLQFMIYDYSGFQTLKVKGPLEKALLQVARWSTTNRIAKTKKRLSIQELRHFINSIIIEVICSTPFFSNFIVLTFASSTYNSSPLNELAPLGSGPTSQGFHYLSWFKQEGGVVWISPGQVVTKSITHKFRYMTNSLV